MATASIVNLYNRMMDLGKQGTSGMDNQESFNGKIDSVQKSLTEMLIFIAEDNQKISDALNWLKKSSSITSGSGGVVTLPSDYLHIDTLSYVANGKKYPMSKLRSNEVDMTNSSPIRGDEATALNEMNYWFIAGNVMINSTGTLVFMRYYMQCPAATIVLTPVSDSTGDYITPSVGTEFGWPLSMYNLLLYMTLELYGIEVKENLLVEYAQYGISKEMVSSYTKPEPRYYGRPGYGAQGNV